MSDRQYRYDPKGCQSLLGYGRAVHARSGGVCEYCGLGKERVDFSVWRQLSVDHVVPVKLFSGRGRTLRSVFPKLPNVELRKLAKEINRINLVTACNFCNSMTSRMDFAINEILSSDSCDEATSVDAEPVQDMLGRLEQRVAQVLPMKRNRVRQRLAELRKTFDEEVRPELEAVRNRPEVKVEVLDEIDKFQKQLVFSSVLFSGEQRTTHKYPEARHFWILLNSSSLVRSPNYAPVG
ncbi:MAG: hypothetical protein M1305_04500 [Candidatus Marsarchaeota archaeon]|nr:hypothetical protein [Candidatus Marsarchaeota archaeon]